MALQVVWMDVGSGQQVDERDCSVFAAGMAVKVYTNHTVYTHHSTDGHIHVKNNILTLFKGLLAAERVFL